MVLLREKRTSSEISEVKFEIRQSVSQIKGLCGIGQDVWIHLKKQIGVERYFVCMMCKCSSQITSSVL